MTIKEIHIYPETKKDFEGCNKCMYSDDSEAVCRARLCVHAIRNLYECFKPRGSEEADNESDG